MRGVQGECLVRGSGMRPLRPDLRIRVARRMSPATICPPRPRSVPLRWNGERRSPRSGRSENKLGNMPTQNLFRRGRRTLPRRGRAWRKLRHRARFHRTIRTKTLRYSRQAVRFREARVATVSDRQNPRQSPVPRFRSTQHLDRGYRNVRGGVSRLR